MTSSTLISTGIGLAIGGVAGYFGGEMLKKQLGPDAPELASILGAIAGAVVVPAIAMAASPVASAAAVTPVSTTAGT